MLSELVLAQNKVFVGMF